MDNDIPGQEKKLAVAMNTTLNTERKILISITRLYKLYIKQLIPSSQTALVKCLLLCDQVRIYSPYTVAALTFESTRRRPRKAVS